LYTNPNSQTPDAWNSTSLLAYYSPITITDSLFSNAFSIRRWATARAFRALSRPVDATLWPEFGVHAFNAQARYYAHYNSIQVPAGITQKPIYLENAPSYITYGSIGMVAGHEITHGFDTNGREWDNNRRYKEWWDEESEVAFANLTKCFVDQFNAIPVVDQTGQPVLNGTGQQAYVNGTLTISENIADAGGMASAWDAWRRHEAASPSQRLPGLDEFSNEQLFFLAAGQMWCSKSSHEDLLVKLKTDAHAPAFARVEAVSRNSKGFREAWGCKVRKPECEIW
jgi:endothelin-converting enzyme